MWAIFNKKVAFYKHSRSMQVKQGVEKIIGLQEQSKKGQKLGSENNVEKQNTSIQNKFLSNIEKTIGKMQGIYDYGDIRFEKMTKEMF